MAMCRLVLLLLHSLIKVYFSDVGAAQWKSMSDDQKAPWKKLAGTDSRKYAATKPTMIKAKPSMAKAKAKPKAKSCAAKPKARPKVTFAKAKVGKVSAKLTKSKVAGTKKSPKTIRRIKITKTAKTVKKIKPSKTAKTTRKIKVCSYFNEDALYITTENCRFGYI